MRVLLTTWGSRGDVEPVAALAARLRELGAEVRVCAPPDEEFVALFDSVGVPLIPLGASVRSTLSADKPDPFKIAAAMVAARFETLTEAAQGCDVLMATGLMPAGARSVAEKLGIRYVFAHLQAYGLPVPDCEPQTGLGQETINALYLEPLNSHRVAIGLPPVDDVRDHVFTSRLLLASDPILDPWRGRTDLDVVQTGAWLLPDPRPLPADLVAFLDAGEPPVYVGFGSMNMRGSDDVAKVVIESVRAQGRRIVLGRGWAGLSLVDNQDDCFVVGESNHRELFRRVAGVVHHGGAGTTTTAAVAGVPQVVLPQIGDQPFWATRVADLGIGVAHDGSVPTFDSLSAALSVVLTAQTQVRAKAVAETIRTDGAAVAAKLLIESQWQDCPV
jgi:vancomycin aglycone glucosyltransferase